MKKFRTRTDSSTIQVGGFLEERMRYPVVAEVDVVVAGGGPAGIGAAIGAAREGARVMLVERNSFLGGTATAVQMATWDMAVERMTGYSYDLATELVERGGAVGGGVSVPFDPEIVKQVTLEHIRKNDIDLLLYSSICGPVMDGDVVKGIIVENKSGRQALLAKTVIDCTGDADVAARAGATYVMGREKDNAMRPMTVLVRLGGMDLPKLVDYARSHPEDFDPDTSFHVLDIENGLLRIIGFYSYCEAGHERGDLDRGINYLRFEGVQVDKGVAFVNSVRIFNVDGTNAFDLTKAELQAREQIEQLVAFIQANIPGCEESYVIDTSSNMGVRETRRIVGAHTLTEEEVHDTDHHPSDSIAKIWRYLAPGLDSHSPDPGVEGSKGDLLHRGAERPLISFQIPYGVLVPENVDGLLVGGRSISTTHMADRATRGMYCCMVTGQAAGTAAALAAASGTTPRNVNIDDLQKALVRQGVDIGA
ncbi:MAG: dependent oxidoreductase [Marmoricola sp.]|nr:dependent oxidoreductase [Marmoricola sp.]